MILFPKIRKKHFQSLQIFLAVHARKSLCISVLIAIMFILGRCVTPNQKLNDYYQFSQDIDPQKDGFHFPDLVFIPDNNRIEYANSFMESIYYKEANNDLDNLFGSHDTIDAMSFVLQASRNTEILILNEAHHRPNHRIFAQKLLKGLKANGYKNLGLEGLTNSSHFPLEAYPKPQNGYYINEPNFANFIREAIRLEFNIFSYESTGKSGKEREIGQAKNIQNFLANHPEGKTFIYCGYSHNNEGAMGSWEKSMAGRLKEYLNVDPYTLNQFYYNDIDYVRGHNPVVLVDSTKKAYGLPGRFDLFVFHPKYLSETSKPTWKITESNRLIPVDFIPERTTYPVIIAAFKNKAELKNGIPLDIVEMTNKKENRWLCVPKNGDYELAIFDANRKNIKLNNK